MEGGHLGDVAKRWCYRSGACRVRNPRLLGFAGRDIAISSFSCGAACDCRWREGLYVMLGKPKLLVLFVDLWQAEVVVEPLVWRAKVLNKDDRLLRCTLGATEVD